MTPFCVRLRGDDFGSPGLSNSFLIRKVVTWWFFAELNRVLSGVLDCRVDATTSCVELQGDGLGLPGLSSRNQSMEKGRLSSE